MRILLFDPYAGGHHGLYVAAFGRVLSARHEVIAAAPTSSLRHLGDADVDRLALDDALVHLKVEEASRAQDAALLRECIRRSGADQAVHLFADAALPNLLGRPPDVPTTVVLFRPRAHWRDLGGIPPSPRERAVGRIYELAVAAWLRRGGAVLTLDPVAAERWSNRNRSVAWLPEPPVTATPNERSERTGGVIYGALSARKGLHHVTAALEQGAHGLELTLAGAVNSEFEAPLADAVERLRGAGASVRLRTQRLDEREALDVLASARVVLLPYVGHIGMSRVLLEAAVAGTPVLAHDAGLLGYLVRHDGLGETVDCRRPELLGDAIRRLADPASPLDRFLPSLSRFATRHSAERFTAAVTGAIDRV